MEHLYKLAKQLQKEAKPKDLRELSRLTDQLVNYLEQFQFDPIPSQYAQHEMDDNVISQRLYGNCNSVGLLDA